MDHRSRSTNHRSPIIDHARTAAREPSLPPPSAFTLVEVVASLALVGTLLVAVLAAHNRASRQLRLAQRRIEAVALLDELVAKRLSADPGELQLARGKVPGDNPYRWRSELRHDRSVAALGAAVLRIELFDPAFQEGATVASVELLQPSGQSIAPMFEQ